MIPWALGKSGAVVLPRCGQNQRAKAAIAKRRALATNHLQWSYPRFAITRIVLYLGFLIFRLAFAVAMAVLLYPGETIAIGFSASKGRGMLQYVILWFNFFLILRILSSFGNSIFTCAILRMLPRVVPGIYPVLGWTALLTEIKLQLFDSLWHNWGGGLFYNYWVSFCGVDVQGGPGNNEISRVYGLLPDVTCIGANSFWGNGAYCLAVEREACGMMSICSCRFPTQLFLGNKAVVSAGSYPTDTLIGIGSFVPKHRLKRRLNAERDRAMTVFGNPLFNMPLRQEQRDEGDSIINERDPEKSLFLPTFYEFLRRMIVFECVRWGLRAAIACMSYSLLRCIIPMVFLFPTLALA